MTDQGLPQAAELEVAMESKSIPEPIQWLKPDAVAQWYLDAELMLNNLRRGLGDA